MKNFVKLSFTPLNPITMTIKGMSTIFYYRVATITLIWFIGILAIIFLVMLEKEF